MLRGLCLSFLAVALVACNSGSPAGLGDFNASLVDGKWGFTFSGSACAPADIEMNLGRFRPAGAVPQEIQLNGSWQTVGEAEVRDLTGTLIRDSGEVHMDLIVGVSSIDGVFLDVDNIVAGYTNVTSGCRARVSGTRIE